MARLAVALALALCLLACGAHARKTTETEHLDDACLDGLSYILSNYSSPAVTTPECDAACFAECGELVEHAIYPATEDDCPRVTQLATCLKLFSAEWEAYVRACALLDWDGTDGEGATDTDGEGGTGRRLFAESEAESEAASQIACFPNINSVEEWVAFVEGTA